LHIVKFHNVANIILEQVLDMFRKLTQKACDHTHNQGQYMNAGLYEL